MADAFASRLGLIAFAATALECAWSGMDAYGGITLALVRLLTFYALGWVVGAIAGWLMEEVAQRDFEDWKSAAEQTDVAAMQTA